MLLRSLEFSRLLLVVSLPSLLLLERSARLLGLVLCSMSRWAALRRLRLLLCFNLEYLNFIVFTLFEVSSLRIDNQMVSTPVIWLPTRSYVLLDGLVLDLVLVGGLFRGGVYVKDGTMGSLYCE